MGAVLVGWKFPRLSVHNRNSAALHHVQIDWARFYGFDELTEFLGAIALHVTSNDPKRAENLAAQQAIMAALTQNALGRVPDFAVRPRRW